MKNANFKQETQTFFMIMLKKDAFFHQPTLASLGGKNKTFSFYNCPFIIWTNYDYTVQRIMTILNKDDQDKRYEITLFQASVATLQPGDNVSNLPARGEYYSLNK